MHRLDFAEALTAREIREPLVIASLDVADSHYIAAEFVEKDQRAYRQPPYRLSNQPRTRYGYEHHKNWFIRYYEAQPNNVRPNLIGDLIIRSLFDPGQEKYGGFDYGRPGAVQPTYQFITLQTPAEAALHQPDIDPKLYDATVSAVTEIFEERHLLS